MGNGKSDKKTIAMTTQSEVALVMIPQAIVAENKEWLSMVKVLTAMKWKIQLLFCFNPFEVVINMIFDDSTVECIVYLLIAGISSVFICELSSKLGRIVRFEENIVQPTI